MQGKYILFILVWISSCHVGISKRKSSKYIMKTPKIEDEFISQLKDLINTLPLHKRCKMIQETALLSNSTSACVSVLLLSHKLIPEIGSCQFNSTCTVSPVPYIASVASSYERRMIEFFNRIPEPFQCYIVHMIALKAKGGLSRYPSIKKVERTLMRSYGQSLEVGSKCSRVSTEKRDRVLFTGLVDATLIKVSFNDTEKWINKFKRTISAVYFSSFTDSRARRTKKPPPNASRDPLVPERETNLYTLPFLNISDFEVRVLKVSKEFNNVRALFYMLVKGHVFGTIVKSDEIINTFNNNKVRRKLALRMGARRVKFSLPRSQVKSGGRWQVSGMSRVRKYLPRRLFPFYKTLENSGHCFILLHIAVKLKTKLDDVETLLTTTNHLTQDLLCTRLTEEKTTEVNQDKSSGDKPPWVPPSERGPVVNTTDDKFEGVFDRQVTSEKKSMSPLEISLFVLLAILCLAIFAFLMNCVLFTVRGGKKAKRLNVGNHSVLAGAVLGDREITESNRTSQTSNSNNDEERHVSRDNDSKDLAESPT